MKSIFLAFLFLLSGIHLAVFAQTPGDVSDSSNVLIVQKDWRMEVINPELEENPFRANDSLRQTVRDQKNNDRDNKIRNKSGEPLQQKINRNPLPEAVTSPEPSSSAIYTYEVKIKNVGEKTIQNINWDYVFFEQDTKQEIGRQLFASKINILPGKTKSLTVRSPAPPTSVIKVSNGGKRFREKYSEQVIIQTIEYVDGSVWKAVATPKR